MKTAREIQRHVTYRTKTQTLNQMIEGKDSTIRRLRQETDRLREQISAQEVQITSLHEQVAAFKKQG